MLPCVCSITDHRRCQNVVRTSVTHSAIALFATFCSYHIICDILLKRRMATWNLFVKQKAMIHAHVTRIPKNKIKLKKKNGKKEQNIYDQFQLHAIMNVHE